MHDSTDRQTQSGTIGVGIAANVTSVSRWFNELYLSNSLSSAFSVLTFSFDPYAIILSEGASNVTLSRTHVTNFWSR